MSKRLNQIKQLDALRALAAFTVVLYHFLPEYELGKISYGWMGVDVFFVISGYLITAILLEQKNSIQNKLLIIRNFILKRALRLFPIYYLFVSFFLIFMYLFHLYAWDTGNAIYFYSYTQNILFFKEGMKGVQTNHLWTLAVEEQFYLFWPWLVIYIHNKNLIRSLFIVILFTLLLKSFSNVENLRMLTMAHFDTLGGGALIALLMKEKGEGFLLFMNKLKFIGILLSLLVLGVATFYKIHPFFTCMSVFTLSMNMVMGSYYNFKGIPGRILNLPWLQYLGKISYGLYLYHKPIPYFLKIIVGKLHVQANPWMLLVLSIFLTVLVAHLSFHLLEKRFLKLKEKFDL